MAKLSDYTELINIVGAVQRKEDGERILREMGDRVALDFDNDKVSRSEWEYNTAEAIKLFTGFMPPKTIPWENCSNVCLPLLAIACLQFQARAYDALVPPRGVVNTIATGGEGDIAKADRVRKYMDFQLLHKMETFEEGMDKTLMQLPIVGSVFRKTYFDLNDVVVNSEYVSAADVVINYNTKVGIEKAHRKTHILYLMETEVNERVDKGIFDSGVRGLGPGSIATLKSPIKEASDQAQGIKPSPDSLDIPRVFLEQHRGWDLDGDGVEEPYIITIDYETKKVARITDRRYIDFLGRKGVVEHFTHYVFIPNPEGFYGLGFGLLHSRMNKAANDIINEVVDAGELANRQGGFVSRRSGIKRGGLSFVQGEFKEVDTYIDDINKAIFKFDFPGPNQTLYAVLGLLFEYSKLLASISETMTGQLPASDTPATTVMALIEEGRKVFSTIHKRIHRSFKKELKKIFRLNSIYLDEIEYYVFLEADKTMQGEIGKRDFVSTIDVIPVSDPNITSRVEKVLKAQQVYQTTMTNPLTAQNPTVIFNATRRLYEALEVPNIPEILQPPQPPQDVPPEQENAMAMNEQPINVLPQQDHMNHVAVHEDMMNGAFADELSPASKKILEKHRKEHVAHLYLASAEQLKAQGAALESQARAGRII